MIGIVFATEEEANPFLSRYQRGRFSGLSDGETLSDDHLLVSLTGVGKIKATLRTERLLHQHRLTRLLHVGTCTSLREDLKSGVLVAASKATASNWPRPRTRVCPSTCPSTTSPR